MVHASTASVERGARSRPPWPWPTLLRRTGLPECRDLSRTLLLDASTVLISLVLSTLNAANIIDTRLGILRLFRLLRVPAG